MPDFRPGHVFDGDDETARSLLALGLMNRKAMIFGFRDNDPGTLSPTKPCPIAILWRE